MKRFQKQILIFSAAAVMMLSPLYSWAMMGGHGGGGSMGGGYGSQGTMGYDDGHMTGGDHGAYGDHRNNTMGWGNSGAGGSMSTNGRYMGQRMDPAAAERMMRNYMSGRHNETFTMGPMTDGGSYYQSEAVRPDGSVMERVIIDKNSGRVHALR